MHARSTRLTLVIIAAATVVLLGAGAAWWFAARTDSAAGPPVERSDGLPADTAMGITELKVRALEEVQDFYVDAVGMTVLTQAEDEVLLGVAEEPLIRLARSDAPPAQADEAGLYHTAILYADAPTLAETLLRIAQQAPERFQGASDHRVSEAFYFADPEGNGLELYVDRPRAEWVWNDGTVEMGSEPLDPNQFIQDHLGDDALGTAALGHMHLKVGDLAEARAFYADTLGFDVVAETEGALFYSAGGYHHHLATNTWASAGTGARTTEAGLGSLTITLPDRTDVERVADRLEAAGLDHEPEGDGILVADPWGNTIRLTVASP